MQIIFYHVVHVQLVNCAFWFASKQHVVFDYLEACLCSVNLVSQAFSNLISTFNNY